MTRRVPSLVPGVDIFSLPLTTVEGFVLSRVDGGVSVEDISMMSGIDQTKLVTILERLLELGAVNLPWLGERGKVAQRAPVAAVRPPSSRQVDAHFALGEGRYDAAELDAESDLSFE